MPTRFRKTIKIAPGVKVNVGKNGASVSVGGKGAHVTIGKNGKKTVSTSIPGTGIYHTETINTKQNKAAKKQAKAAKKQAKKDMKNAKG